MRTLFSGWKFPLSAAACVALLITATLLLTPGSQARAAEVLAKGALAVAKLGSIHLQCRIRAQANDNFVGIAPDQDFTALEVWKQFGTNAKWRIEKPSRVAVMDGQSTVQYFKNTNLAMKCGPSVDAYDTNLAKEQGVDGRMKSIVSILAKSSLPEDDYLKNKFMDDSDTRRVYRFDAQTGVLEGAQYYLTRASGDVLIFEITRIECNRPIEARVFQLDLPGNVAWLQDQPLKPGDEKYVALSAVQAARTYFEACGRGDWQEVGKLRDGSPLSEGMKQRYAGLVVRSIGQPFTSKASRDQFVPYEIQLKDGTVKKWNLALRRNEQTAMWFVDGGY